VKENIPMTTRTSPLLTLNNGVQIPAIGLGVFQSAPEQTAGAVESALTRGYRLVDTAAAYFNEVQVGEGLRRAGISRNEVFLETKIWISDYGYDATLHAFDKSARKLGVDRIDLLLLHQPLPSRFGLTLDAYRALEKLLADGKVRAIGVSNFMPSTSVDCLPTRPSSPPSTRSNCIRTSSRGPYRSFTLSTASSPRPGHRLAGSPPTMAAARAHSTIPRCRPSPATTGSRPRR
jgi:hypothetical protein